MIKLCPINSLIFIFCLILMHEEMKWCYVYKFCKIIAILLITKCGR